ncbi:MAG: hypothetical protein M3P84_10370, partial [Chloroflexota bacterium]|nr:hypothetical protein [Chloroflexota bacterium]
MSLAPGRHHGHRPNRVMPALCALVVALTVGFGGLLGAGSASAADPTDPEPTPTPTPTETPTETPTNTPLPTATPT